MLAMLNQCGSFMSAEDSQTQGKDLLAYQRGHSSRKQVSTCPQCCTKNAEIKTNTNKLKSQNQVFTYCKIF